MRRVCPHGVSKNPRLARLIRHTADQPPADGGPLAKRDRVGSGRRGARSEAGLAAGDELLALGLVGLGAVVARAAGDGVAVAVAGVDRVVVLAAFEPVGARATDSGRLANMVTPSLGEAPWRVRWCQSSSAPPAAPESPLGPGRRPRRRARRSMLHGKPARLNCIVEGVGVLRDDVSAWRRHGRIQGGLASNAPMRDVHARPPRAPPGPNAPARAT